MKVEPIAIAKLKPAPYNPRTLSDDRCKDLQRSLDEFELVEPLVWNKQTGHVVGGNHHRDGSRNLGSCHVGMLIRCGLIRTISRHGAGLWPASARHHFHVRRREYEPMKCQTTGCNNESEAPHTCPCKGALGDAEDAEELCNCCDDCEWNCAEHV